jgi:hypothetical protein
MDMFLYSAWIFAPSSSSFTITCNIFILWWWIIFSKHKALGGFF